MPTIKDSLYFNYDGVSCKNYNLMNVNVDNSSMYSDIFHPTRTISETAVKGSDTPLYNGVDEATIEFPLTIAFTDGFTDADIDNIIVWLFQDIYKPFYFEDKPDRIFYCMPNGDANIVHNGLQQGYFTVTMKCKSSRIYSPQQTTQTYDLSANYIVPPTVAPTLSLYASTGSTLTATTYYVGYTWYNAQGETTIGSYTIPSLAVTSGNGMKVTVPTPPSNATGTKIYVGTSPTDLIYQTSLSNTSTTFTFFAPINTTNSTSPTSNTTVNTSAFDISINNGGHVDIYPEISFVKVGNGVITFTKDGQIFEVENLADGENIYINCEREIIETDAVGVWHYSDVVGDFFDIVLHRGDNTVSVNGACKDLQLRYVLKYKF